MRLERQARCPHDGRAAAIVKLDDAGGAPNAGSIGWYLFRSGGKALPLAYGPPNEALARELRQVARAADLLAVALAEVNALPESFPEDELQVLCRWLEGLPEGTAEGCRVQLELARNLLPKIRRENFVEDDDDPLADDAAPPLHRDGMLDQRINGLIGAVATALDEYRYQAQQHFDDTTRAEATVTVEPSTAAALRADADAVIAGVNGTVRELDERGISATGRGEVLRRRLKDGENLSRAAKAQLGVGPVVRRWLSGIGAALRRTPELVKAAGQALEVGVDIAEPFADWWETTRRDAWASLFKSVRGFADALQKAAERLPARARPTLPERPAWAVDGGRDAYGEWLDFEFAGVRQRLRWIPPGRFLMGSPKDEDGRFDDEGPQHEVTFAAGFWLFDTPLTQALYEAVTGANPSHRKGPARPVEQVSWHQAEEFIQRLNAALPGLSLRLPLESEWEYACRAGSTAARYAEPLADIAWYGENSGGETQPVRGKAPNAWGLFDMLGNVFEWCSDAWHDDYQGAPIDGSVWDDWGPSADRVVRGGSWGDGARRCRAACRYRLRPDSRDGNLGFRPARGRG